jgi:cobalt-zinc-cadmium resistance protein CzcA
VKGANSIKIVGPDLAVLERIAVDAMREMAQVRGIADLGIFRVLGQPNLNIRVDRPTAARYGLSVADVNSVVQAALGGTVATTLLEADRQFAVTVRLAPEYRGNLDAVRNLKVGVQTPGGNAYIPLSDIASITLDTGASYIFRERNQRFVPIKFSVRGRDLGSTVIEVQRKVAAEVPLPAGYRLEWVGEFGNLQDAIQRLQVVVPLSIALIALLLYLNFSSVADTLLALSVIPMALIGGIFALFLTGTAFSISAAIGFIALFGAAVLNGVVMVSYINQLREAGTPLMTAVVQGAQTRLRTVLMTSMLAMFGLLPMALSHGIGSETQRPLAVVIIGGLVSATVLTLIVLPTLYVVFESRAARPSLHGRSS